MTKQTALHLQRMLSDEQAIAAFDKWLDRGIFSRKHIRGDISTHLEAFTLGFLRIEVVVTGSWSANVGVLNRREWERDVATHMRDIANWERSGKASIRPRSPTKSNYIDWHDESDRWEDRYECTLPAFGLEHVGGNRKVFAACSRFNAEAWKYWRSARSIEAGEADILLEPAAVDEVLISAGVSRFQSWFKSNVAKRFDEVGKPGHDFHWEKVRIDFLQAPFLSIDYTFSGKDYRYVTDLVEGSCTGGSKPIDSKKVAWASGIAASVAALGGGAYAFLGSPSQPEVAALTRSAETPAESKAYPVDADLVLAGKSAYEPEPADANIASLEDMEGGPLLLDAIGNPLPADSADPALPDEGAPALTRRAAPRMSLAALVTSDDYPQTALQEGAEGVSVYRLTVGSDGRPTACSIVGSSGSEALDMATCRLMQSRGRFHPALGSDGSAVADSFVGRVGWKLDQAEVRAAAATSAAIAPAVGTYSPPSRASTGVGVRLASAAGGRVLVTEVIPGGAGAQQGVQLGDLVQTINGEVVSTQEQAAAAVARARRNGEPVLAMLIQRRGRTIALDIPLQP